MTSEKLLALDEVSLAGRLGAIAKTSPELADSLPTRGFQTSYQFSKSSTLASASQQPEAGDPDLIVNINHVRMPRSFNREEADPKPIRAPEQQGRIQVTVTNQGNQTATGRIKLKVSASPDLILDSGDQPLNTADRDVQISLKKSKRFTLDFAHPNGVAPGAYHLFVTVDSDNTIAESNENNNTTSKRVSENGTDVVIDWNATALNAISTDRTLPPAAARNLAIMHKAVYDAVNSQLPKKGDESLSRVAAAAAAAHRVLTDLYPAQTATLDAQLSSSLAEVPDGKRERRGVAFGRSVAEAVLASRSNDGANSPVSYTPRANPGDWQPTPPANLSALLPQWKDVKPFAMTSSDQFRPAGFPALNSVEYAVDFNEVKDIGSLNSTTRTETQTEIAWFWADGAGTFTPSGHWNLIAEQVAIARENTLEENARLFAVLNIAQADAGIAAWDAKYRYNLWRPITAIRQAEIDGNPDTIADSSWLPLITTPPFPEYVSGHSTFSGAASTVLAAFFGDNLAFETSSIGLPGVVRSFTSFSQAADEAGISRIYGGIHFQSANQDGLLMGRALGDYVVKNFSA